MRSQIGLVAGALLLVACTEYFPPTVPVTPTRPNAELLDKLKFESRGKEG